MLMSNSQGAQVTHNAAAMLSATTTGFVNSGMLPSFPPAVHLADLVAVVLFGDPFKGRPVGNIPASKVKTFCNFGDNICDGGALVLYPHLTYRNDADAAAAFVRSKAGI